MNTTEFSGLEIFKRELLEKKLEIMNKSKNLEDALQNPIKYSHIRFREDQEEMIQEWYIPRAMELLLIDKETAEKEYSWFRISNF